MTTTLTTAIICTAILTAMLFLLGLNVSRMRGVTAKAGGSQFPSDSASRLLIAIRAHGNAAEYIPALIVLFLLVGARSPAAVAIPLIIGATAARVIHAYGLLTAPSLAVQTKARLAGAAGTYFLGVGLAVAAAFSL
jgi:uncharacterized membrane protein YecN with MAPEG domain